MYLINESYAMRAIYSRVKPILARVFLHDALPAHLEMKIFSPSPTRFPPAKLNHFANEKFAPKYEITNYLLVPNIMETIDPLSQLVLHFFLHFPKAHARKSVNRTKTTPERLRYREYQLTGEK